MSGRSHVLGLTIGHAGAALSRDGRLVAAVNEDRLCRIQLVAGFPRQSVFQVLGLGGVSVDRLDLVLVAARHGFFVEGLKPFEEWLTWERSGGLGARVKRVAGKLSRFRDRFPVLERLYYACLEPSFAKQRRRVRAILKDEFGVTCPIRFVDHHVCHAASAAWTSGFDPALVLTLDGGGDGRSGLVCRANAGRLEVLHDISSFNSLGNYYAYVTRLCGFSAHKEEGKVTGLAAHGRPLYVPILRDFIDEEDGTIRNTGGLVFHAAIEALRERLPDGWRREDLAASVQAHAEDLVTRFARHWLRETGLRDLAVAGGVFANVSVNHRLAELPEVDRLFVHPGMTDEGLAAGASLCETVSTEPDSWKPRARKSAAREGSRAAPGTREPLSDVYLGPEPSEEEIDQALAAHGLRAEPVEGPVEVAVAGLLAAGHVVARAAGRMEYGPRALGNRSILYQPTDVTVMEWLNEKLDRTEFMPFAPAVLYEARNLCFHGVERAEHSAEFMTVTFQCTEFMKRAMPGAVHVDGTARPQLVRREANPSFHRTLEAYRERSGLPGVINTSFNMHGEPIACSADDCVRTFLTSGVDYLALGSRLIRNPAGVERRPAARSRGRRSSVRRREHRRRRGRAGGAEGGRVRSRGGEDPPA